MYNTECKTGFIGIVWCMRSFSRMHAQLVIPEDGPLKYLLGYKFSQDHLELFFSAIRARGGFNDNPTALQFKAAYKRLLLRADIKMDSGNTIPLDDTFVLSVGDEGISAANTMRKYDLLVRDPAQGGRNTSYI